LRYCRLILLRHPANQMPTLFVYIFYRYQMSLLQSWLSFEAVLMMLMLCHGQRIDLLLRVVAASKAHKNCCSMYMDVASLS
jgi:hypothetical protein